jgi:hypothetical protein
MEFTIRNSHTLLSRRVAVASNKHFHSARRLGKVEDNMDQGRKNLAWDAEENLEVLFFVFAGKGGAGGRQFMANWLKMMNRRL